MTSPEEEAIEREEIVEPEEMSVTAYRMYLLETRWNLQTKVRNAEGLLGRLDVALEDRKLRVYLFETEKGVHIATQEKGQLSFPRAQASDPIPEGGSRISQTRFIEILDGSRQKYLGQISEVEGLLEALDDALNNDEVRIHCFSTDDGVGMETEEKGPLGFVFQREEN